MSITDELRECARVFRGVWVNNASQTITFTTSSVAPTVDSIRMDSRLLAIAGRIDEEHRKAIASVMNDALYHANDKDMADLGWVRKNKEHVISHATVEVTPHIDWSRMADELDEFVKIVRSMAGGAE